MCLCFQRCQLSWQGRCDSAAPIVVSRKQRPEEDPMLSRLCPVSLSPPGPSPWDADTHIYRWSSFLNALVMTSRTHREGRTSSGDSKCGQVDIVYSVIPFQLGAPETGFPRLALISQSSCQCWDHRGAPAQSLP